MIKREDYKRYLLFFLMLFFVWGSFSAAKGGRPAKKKRAKPRFGAPLFQYNYKIKEVELRAEGRRQAWIRQEKSVIYANKIYWNDKTGIGRCYGRVRIIDKQNDVLITGEEAWHYSRINHSFVKRKPVLHMKKNKTVVYAKEMHRYSRQKLAKALRDVRIVRKDGTGYGQKAVYDMRKKELVLSGKPWLQQKKDKHRAERITFYQEKQKVMLEGNAYLSRGIDYIKADKIVIVDLEKKKKKKERKKDRLSRADKKNKKEKKKKNRVIYCYGNVAIYRHNKKKKLVSITVGGYAEFHEKTEYAKIMIQPKMIMVSDNTIVNSAVLEQYKKDDLAVATGSVKVVKQYRTITGQLARYFLKNKKIFLTGNPVITEYDDSYRADVVIFDTAKDVVNWQGSSIAVIGVTDQATKQSNWAKKYGGNLFAKKGSRSIGRLLSVVGDVFLSSSGKPITNKSSVSYGMRASKKDGLPALVNIVIPSRYGWADFVDLSGGGRFRIKGSARLQFARAVKKATKGRAKKGAKKKKDFKKNSVKKKKSALDKKIAQLKQRVGRSKATYQMVLHKGLLYRVPEVLGAPQRVPFISGGLMVTNLSSPFIAHRIQDKRISFVALSNTNKSANLVLTVAPLKQLRFSKEDAKLFKADSSPILKFSCGNERLFHINHDKFLEIETRLYTFITNETALAKQLAKTNSLLTNASSLAKTNSVPLKKKNAAKVVDKKKSNKKKSVFSLKYRGRIKTQLLKYLRLLRATVKIDTRSLREPLWQRRIQELIALNATALRTRKLKSLHRKQRRGPRRTSVIKKGAPKKAIINKKKSLRPAKKGK